MRDQFFFYLTCNSNIRLFFHEVLFIYLRSICRSNYSIINLEVFSDEIIKRSN